MTKNFGPWATAASAGSKAQLSTFWKSRLRMLPATRRSSARLSSRTALFLLIGAASFWFLPTLRTTEQADAWATDEPGQTGRGTMGTIGTKSTSIWCLAFSPDSQTMAGGARDGRVVLWDAESNDNGQERTILTTKQDWMTAIGFDSSGESLFLAGKEVERWNAKTWQRTRIIGLEGVEGFRINSLSRDCANAAGTKGRALRIWDTGTGRITHTFSLMGIGLKAMFSPDRRLVAVGTMVDMGDTEGKKSGVQIWDLSSGQLKRAILVPNGSISAVEFSHDGKVIAGGTHREVLVWDADTGDLKQRFRGVSGPIEAIAFSPDDEMVAAGGQGPELRRPNQVLLLSEMKVWNLKTRELVKSNVGELGRNTSLAFSPDGRRLARCDYRSVMVDNLVRPGTSWTRSYEQ